MKKQLGEEVLIMLDVSDKTISRIERKSDLSEPLWFGAQFHAAFNSAIFTRNIFYIIKFLLSARHKTIVVFNISLCELFVASMKLIGLSKTGFVSIYQWRRFENLSVLKRLVYKLVLKSSDFICVYSVAQRNYLISNGYVRVRVLPHYTDSEYFSISENISEKKDYILMVGDHRRNEDLANQIALKFNKKLIRVTRDLQVSNIQEKYSNTDLRINISFDELKTLYASAALVINPVYDDEWPVGITTFTEALVMGARIVANHGCSSDHLKSIYPENSNSLGVWLVDDHSLDNWVIAVERALADNTDYSIIRDRRKEIIEFLSIKNCANGWINIIGEMRS